MLKAKQPKKQPAILIVDDDPNNLAVITDYLGDSPYTLLVAEDGEKGIRRAAYARPDLILLDVMMPGIDGFETCRRLKALEATRDIPIIFMTALAETEHKVKAFESGAVDYIVKPFQREEVVARVGVQLRLCELTARLREANESLERRVEERTAELWESRRRLAEIIDFLPDPTFAIDREGRVTVWNRAAEEFTGVKARDMLGKKDREYAIPFYGTRRPALVDLVLEQTPGIEALFPSFSRKDGVVIGEGYVRSARSEEAYVLAIAAPLYDAAGTVVGAIESFRDISERKKAEEEHLRMAAALRQAHKMEAIGTLAAGIAHDFNNILTATLGFTQMALIKLGPEDPGRKEMERVMESSLRAADLVRQILTFSRSTRQERSPVHLVPIVDEVLKLLRSSLPTTIEIRWKPTLSSEHDMVMADATQIHQVLMNLCTNSAHAMQQAGGVLTIDLARVEQDPLLTERNPELKEEGAKLRLTVTDTGHGIDASVMERIFDPYFTTKPAGEGTGMGLAVVQGIVKSHGGAVVVQSERGKGASFHVFFPAIAEAVPLRSEPGESVPRGTERILFVDDELTLAELGEVMLSSLGYRVTATTSSLHALDLFRAAPDAFDLVITDLTMPGMTGVTLAGRIAELRRVPVVLCTGFSEPADEFRKNGIREILQKPYQIDVLATTVRRALKQ